MNIFIFMVVVLLLLNIYVNIRLVLSANFNHFQKTAQSIMIWLLPFIGVLIVYYFVYDQSRILTPNKYNSSSSGTPYGSSVSGDGLGG